MKKSSMKMIIASLSILFLSFFIFGDLAHANGVVFFVMALGGFWVIGCLVIAGMILAGSQGNPQRRTSGFVALLLALVGAWVIFKAYDIAAWATGLGGAA